MLNSVAVFTCHNVSELHSKEFRVKWYKDGSPISTNNGTFLLWDEYLLVKNISPERTGDYYCELFKDGIPSPKKSPVKKLSISSGMYFIYVTLLKFFHSI